LELLTERNHWADFKQDEVQELGPAPAQLGADAPKQYLYSSRPFFAQDAGKEHDV